MSTNYSTWLYCVRDSSVIFHIYQRLHPTNKHILKQFFASITEPHYFTDMLTCVFIMKNTAHSLILFLGTAAETNNSNCFRIP